MHVTVSMTVESLFISVTNAGSAFRVNESSAKMLICSTLTFFCFCAKAVADRQQRQKSSLIIFFSDINFKVKVWLNLVNYLQRYIFILYFENYSRACFFVFFRSTED